MVPNFKWDLGFGNSVCVRDAFLKIYHGNMVVFSSKSLARFDYPDRDGDKDLINLTREVIQRQLGRSYKHILITNGATGGVVIACRAYAQMGYIYCHTRNAPWYLRYPTMIEASGMLHVDEQHHVWENESIHLLDLPSNPLNSMNVPNHGGPRIIDGVYLNRVYAGAPEELPPHEVMVGSYSKLTGLNGLRVGWIATDNDLLYERMKNLTIGEYCGLSVASTDIIRNILFQFNWELFENTARSYLDYNRGEFSKLEKYFGDTPVSSLGMFYYCSTDAKCRELLEKAGIKYTKGSDLGTNDDFGRFNLGQSREVIEQSVKSFLKTDRLK